MLGSLALRWCINNEIPTCICQARLITSSIYLDAYLYLRFTHSLEVGLYHYAVMILIKMQVILQSQISAGIYLTCMLYHNSSSSCILSQCLSLLLSLFCLCYTFVFCKTPGKMSFSYLTLRRLWKNKLGSLILHTL